MQKRRRVVERLRGRWAYVLAVAVGIALAEIEVLSPVQWMARWLGVSRPAAVFLMLAAFGVACFAVWLRRGVNDGKQVSKT